MRLPTCGITLPVGIQTNFSKSRKSWVEAETSPRFLAFYRVGLVLMFVWGAVTVNAHKIHGNLGNPQEGSTSPARQRVWWQGVLPLRVSVTVEAAGEEVFQLLTAFYQAPNQLTAHTAGEVSWTSDFGSWKNLRNMQWLENKPSGSVTFQRAEWPLITFWRRRLPKSLDGRRPVEWLMSTKCLSLQMQLLKLYWRNLAWGSIQHTLTQTDWDQKQ